AIVVGLVVCDRVLVLGMCDRVYLGYLGMRSSFWFWGMCDMPLALSSAYRVCWV
ncbi:MAG: hypothetical protein HC903_29645, partial [Methylacidiphilales bacterium]|nr:hypothetical protein [Candidatus Methylacidiphilales bacterium]